MFHGLVAMMIMQQPAVKPTLAVGRVENGIIVLRPAEGYRGTLKVIPVDPKYCSKMPGAE